MVKVSRALGHASPTVTLKVYAHLWPDAADHTRRAAAGLFEAAFGSPADALRTEQD